jgi:predicted enzyme related to lactoylglutathione lyase
MSSMPEGYRVLKTGDQMHAGLIGHNGTLPSCWLAYFVVDNIDAAQIRVTELGGAITTPIMNVPEIGKIVSGVDPRGAAFSLHQVE